jgi:hypothetical protein
MAFVSEILKIQPDKDICYLVLTKWCPFTGHGIVRITDDELIPGFPLPTNSLMCTCLRHDSQQCVATDIHVFNPFIRNWLSESNYRSIMVGWALYVLSLHPIVTWMYHLIYNLGWTLVYMLIFDGWKFRVRNIYGVFGELVLHEPW